MSNFFFSLKHRTVFAIFTVTIFVGICRIYHTEVKVITKIESGKNEEHTYLAYNWTDLDYIITYHSKDNNIIITTSDSFYLDITLNFYYSSLLKFNITNYIIGCTFNKACQELESRNIKLVV